MELSELYGSPIPPAANASDTTKSSASEISPARKHRRRISAISAAAISFGLLLLMFATASFCSRTDEFRCRFSIVKFGPVVVVAAGENGSSGIVISHRKLLMSASAKEADRIWGEKRCSTSDLVISQGPTDPLPNGIPTYTVMISNACIARDCRISHIHLNCGWFSSARLVDPRIFKRLSFNNCLVNHGKPLSNGDSIIFQYANTFPYHLSVSSIHC